MILREEVALVVAGTRWFRYCCTRDGLEPRETFLGLLHDCMRRSLHGPFNLPARREAGFDQDELDALLELAPLPELPADNGSMIRA